MGKIVFRVALLVVPLMVVAVASAPEWPARAMMVDEPLRTPLLELATGWDKAVSTPGQQPHVVSYAAVSPVAVGPVPVASPSAGAKVLTPAPVVVAPLVQPTVAEPRNGGTVLLLGDSLMGGVAPGLRSELARTYTLVDKHRSSTGLTNRDYYNWPVEAGTFAQQTPAQWVFIHLGGNDGQDMIVQGKWHKFGSEQWSAQYLARAKELIDNVKTSLPNATVVWIGLPAMRSEAFDQKMRIISALQRQAAEAREVTYIDGHEAMGMQYRKDGVGLDGTRTLLRADDGIHYARDGGRMIAHATLKHVVM